MLEIPPLPEATILLVEVGSTAHGTGIPGGEDHDEMGIVIESPEDVFGLNPRGYRSVMQRTQPDGSRSGPGDVDRTLHSLRRFVRMAASGNPSILMALWAPVLFATDQGHDLQALGDAFVGRHVIPRYRGYMQSQARRLLTDRGREDLVNQYGFDTKYAMHCARLGFQCKELLQTGRLTLPMQGESAQWLLAVRRGDVGFAEWWERAVDLDAELAAFEGDAELPEHCDSARIERWLVNAHLEHWATTSSIRRGNQ